MKDKRRLALPHSFLRHRLENSLRPRLILTVSPPLVSTWRG